MKEIGVIVEARMGSSRLPGKILMEINGTTILKLLLERIKKVSDIKKIIVATTINSKDDILAKYCKDNNIICHRGSENDVMGRVLEAAKINNISTIVEITGDCPLIDPKIISQILNCYINNEADYVGNANIYTYPAGMEVQVFSTKTLEDSYNNTNDILDREHVTLHIKRSGKYSKINIIAPNNQTDPGLGLTLDEEKDLRLIKKIYKYFNHNNFDLDEILDLLNNKNTELKETNNNVERKGYS